jgi:hypothetical protein
MARRTLSLLLALAASATAAAAAAVQAAAAPEFALPSGYASFNDYCMRHLAVLSDAALDELYTNSTSAANSGSGDASLAAPRGCVPGCILPGHGSSVFAPTLRGAARVRALCA